MGYTPKLRRISREISLADRDIYRRHDDYLCRILVCDKYLQSREYEQRKINNNQRHHRSIGHSIFLCHNEIIDKRIPRIRRKYIN